MRNNKITLLLWLVTVLIVSSCKTKEQTVIQQLTEQTKEERLHSLLAQEIAYTHFSASGKVGVKIGADGKNTSADAQVRIIKDEAIQVSFRVPILNMEVARAVITPERILLIDRHNKQYFDETMETVRQLAPFDFDFYSLQALFTNQLFIAGKQEIAPEDFRSFSLSEDEYNIYLTNKDGQKINYDFVSDSRFRILSTEMYKDKEKLHMTWEYDSFEPASDKQLFPRKMAMQVTTPKDTFRMNFSFSNVDVSGQFGIDTKVSGKYTKISYEQIRKALKGLSL